jgi:hypothetical protein
MEEKKKPIPTQFKKGNTIGKETRFKEGHYPLNTVYKPEYVDLMYEFFTDEENRFPTLTGFAMKHNLEIRTLENWINNPDKYPQLSNLYKQCKEIQKERLLYGGLTSAFNPQIVKFVAINAHGMKDKIEQEVKADATFEVKIDVID